MNVYFFAIWVHSPDYLNILMIAAYIKTTGQAKQFCSDQNSTQNHGTKRQTNDRKFHCWMPNDDGARGPEAHFEGLDTSSLF
jgi:hypothetical protein